MIRKLNTIILFIAIFSFAQAYSSECAASNSNLQRLLKQYKVHLNTIAGTQSESPSKIHVIIRNITTELRAKLIDEEQINIYEELLLNWVQIARAGSEKEDYRELDLDLILE